MPLEIKNHTVPHLKALTRSIEYRGGHGHGSTFKQRCIAMKSTILLHKLPKSPSLKNFIVKYHTSWEMSPCPHMFRHP